MHVRGAGLVALARRGEHPHVAEWRRWQAELGVPGRLGGRQPAVRIVEEQQVLAFDAEDQRLGVMRLAG